jgi:tRNA threonylcarbamoyladenosine biosynthesis protein TsaE
VNRDQSAAGIGHAHPEPVTQHLADAAATHALGQRLAERLLAAGIGPGRCGVVLLQGDLGAGKTCLVQGIAAGLGIDEPITSPTFALAQHYAGRLADGTATALVHLDLYRLEQPEAADELLAQEEEEACSLAAVLAVEWPERLSQPPTGAWVVRLELADPADPDAGRIAQLHCSG